MQNLKGTKFRLLSLAIMITMIPMFTHCSPKKKSKLVWDKSIGVIGSQSSPRAADLNADGILDIVIGAGKHEYQHSDIGVLAINGANGEILWKQDSEDQVFGSATFLDINGDSIPEVFIGGRSPHFRALDGKTGDVIWAYDTAKYTNDPIMKHARFNFYNSQVIPDQNNDGISDLLVINGGNPKVGPYVEDRRHPGVLLIFDSKNGNVLAADTMPDGQESYMSPLCFKQPGDDDHTIIFGSGGETLDGNLYMAKLADLMQGKLSNAKVIASENGHGFIAPPAIADINMDGYYDIIAVSHASSFFAINGKDQSIIWKQKIDSTESSNSFGVGYFTGDDIPDFFTFVNKGVWPNSTGTYEVMLDGKDGQIAYMDSIGCTGFSSPVIYDLNGDGYDEAIISINEFDCSLGFYNQVDGTNMENKLLVIDFKTGAVTTINQQKKFKNIFSTPWIGDMDNDQYLDIIYCQYYNALPDPLLFLGMSVKRISSNIEITEAPVWGAYMGSNGDGVFRLESSR